MNKQHKNTDELRDKILAGVDLAFKKLLKTKEKANGKIVVSRDGKIVELAAKDFITTS